MEEIVVNKENEMEMEEELELVELIDEEGNSTRFIMEEMFEYNSKVYCVLVEPGEEEAVLMEMVETEDSMEFLAPSELIYDELVDYYQNLE